jgi:TusA-related sulfurtransferase
LVLTKITVDAKGFSCPQPVVMTKKVLDNYEEGQEVEVIVDNEAARENVKRFAENKGFKVTVEEKEKEEYILNLTK